MPSTRGRNNWRAAEGGAVLGDVPQSTDSGKAVTIDADGLLAFTAAGVLPGGEYDAGNSGSAKTLDFAANGVAQKLTLTGSPTLTVVDPTAAAYVLIVLVQDGTGGRVVTFPAAFQGTPAYDTTLSTTTALLFWFDGASYWFMATSMAKTIIEVYTTPGNNNWMHRAGLKAVNYNIVSGGAGGGSGGKGPSTNNRTGGCGGGGGTRTFGTIAASELTSAVGATQVVVVGDGGAGGAAQTANGNDGNIGKAGGDSSFNSLVAHGGVAGAAGLQSGTTTVRTTITVNGGIGINNARGDLTGVAGNNGVVGTVPGAGLAVYGGGGGGGGLTITTDAIGNGGTGDGSASGTLAGGTAGTAGAGQDGGAGSPTSILNIATGGTGGGGGAANATGNAGKGGDGGLYGGGGGGGGASKDSTGDSGAGGAGAKGIVIITSLF